MSHKLILYYLYKKTITLNLYFKNHTTMIRSGTII